MTAYRKEDNPQAADILAVGHALVSTFPYHPVPRHVGAGGTSYGLQAAALGGAAASPFASGKFDAILLGLWSPPSFTGNVEWAIQSHDGTVTYIRIPQTFATAAASLNIDFGPAGVILPGGFRVLADSAAPAAGVTVERVGLIYRIVKRH